MMRVTRSTTRNKAPPSAGEKESVLSSRELQTVLQKPLPDLNTLLRRYNRRYFDGVIKAFPVQWSPHLCKKAGKTVVFPFRKIRISEKLHVGRKMNVLIDTLLHEMIHAYLYCSNQLGFFDHGDNFVKEMNRINADGAFDITISAERSRDLSRHLQRLWKCDECGEQLVRLRPTPIKTTSDYVARYHATKCGGTWLRIG